MDKDNGMAPEPSEVRKRPDSGEGLVVSTERQPDRPRIVDPSYYLDEFEPQPLFSLMDAVNSLLRRRWLIIVGVLACVFLTGVYLKLQDPIFQATVSFRPSRTQDMSSRIDRAFGTASYDPYEADTLTEYYSNLLTSRPLLERVIRKKFAVGPEKKEADLISYYRAEGPDDETRLSEAIRLVQQNMKISSPRQVGYGRPPSIMSATFSSKDPRLAADIANEILAVLIKYIQDIKDTKAAQSRLFIENQLADTQKLLREAETAQASFLASNKKIVTPDLEAERDRLKRNVTVQEEVFITLKKQLELAKIEEQEKRPSIEIINQAIPPRSRSWPAIRKSVTIAGFLSLFLFCGLAIALDLVRKIDLSRAENTEFKKNVAAVRQDFWNMAAVIGFRRKKNRDRQQDR